MADRADRDVVRDDVGGGIATGSVGWWPIRHFSGIWVSGGPYIDVVFEGPSMLLGWSMSSLWLGHWPHTAVSCGQVVIRQCLQGKNGYESYTYGHEPVRGGGARCGRGRCGVPPGGGAAHRVDDADGKGRTVCWDSRGGRVERARLRGRVRPIIVQ